MKLFWKVIGATILTSVVTSTATNIVCKNGGKIKETFGKKSSRKRSK